MFDFSVRFLQRLVLSNESLTIYKFSSSSRWGVTCQADYTNPHITKPIIINQYITKPNTSVRRTRHLSCQPEYQRADCQEIGYCRLAYHQADHIRIPLWRLYIIPNAPNRSESHEYRSDDYDLALFIVAFITLSRLHQFEDQHHRAHYPKSVRLPRI